MGVWDTLLGLAERSWKDKPRKDTVAAFVRLRNAMVRCQTAYRKYKEIEAEGEVDRWWSRQHEIALKVGTADARHPREAWVDSVIDLGDTIASLNSVLQIYAPEVNSSTRGHFSVEELLFSDEPSKFATMAGVLKLLPAEGSANLGTVATVYDLNGSYDKALADVDAFIRSNFKIEEVLAAEGAG